MRLKPIRPEHGIMHEIVDFSEQLICPALDGADGAQVREGLESSISVPWPEPAYSSMQRC